MEIGVIEMLMHLGTSVITLILLYTGYLVVKKFKGGIIAKFYTYLIIGAIPIIAFHVVESLMLLNIDLLSEGSEISRIIEHFVILFLFAMIHLGTLAVYKEYAALTLTKKRPQ